MGKSRQFVYSLIMVAAFVAFSGVALPCHGEESQGQGSGSTFVTLGLALGNMLDLGLRAGLEYRSLAGPGVKAAVGTDLLPLFVGSRYIITGEALAILPLFRLGRSGAVDLALGVPITMWGNALAQGIWISVGGAARLRFELGSRWAILVRAGGGYLFNIDPVGFHVGADTDLKTSFLPDLEIGAAFRL